MLARRCGCGGHWQALHGTACSTTPWRTPSYWQTTGEHGQRESDPLHQLWAVALAAGANELVWCSAWCTVVTYRL